MLLRKTRKKVVQQSFEAQAEHWAGLLRQGINLNLNVERDEVVEFIRRMLKRCPTARVENRVLNAETGVVTIQFRNPRT